VTHFALVTREGDTLGAVELGLPDWPPGSVIYGRGDEPNLRVVDVCSSSSRRRRPPVVHSWPKPPKPAPRG
jgi:hypothetical protein